MTRILHHPSRAGHRVNFTSSSPLSVSDAIRLYEREAARAIFGPRPRISGVLIEGVVTEINSRDGLAYLTITDHTSSLEIFVRRRELRLLSPLRADKTQILAHGTLAWYDPQNRLQLELRDLQVISGTNERDMMGVGTQGELFVTPRRRPIPALPKILGIITSKNSAALHDQLAVYQDRAPCIRVLHAPAKMDGDGATAEIVSAIKRLSTSGCDIIVITRGGSSTGFSALNDVNVLRAIVQSPVPMVVAVGHANDKTRACSMADKSFITPSAAAYEITRAFEALHPDAQPVQKALTAFEAEVGAEKRAEMQDPLTRLRERLSEVAWVYARLFENAGPITVETVLPNT